ncbi:hypothetical protein [Mangrovicoccus algicola]|uniref:Flagellin n=1 Tax=Mangrovicoccus algicola TaxID=2771008 RepID=A0A8J7CYL5_9RHOB|nr:hypothetical protein [Mangrovicoccus algicola]MBE3639717.1 hypothetical protein [Mangrovicoccus algicola]
MTSLSIGDMAQFFNLRNQTARLQYRLDDSLTELGSGEVADLSSHMRGNFSRISGIEHDLELLDGYLATSKTAKVLLDAQAVSFEKARSYAHDLGMSLIEAAQSADDNLKSATLKKGRSDFNSIISALNVQSSGRSLFSGDATNVRPFNDPEVILASLETYLSSEVDADGVWTAAETWFSAGGGYETVAYQGSDVPLGAISVAPGERVLVDLSGHSPEVRDLVRLHALAAVLDRGTLNLIDAEQRNLMSSVGEGLVNSDRELIYKQAEIGVQQERIDMLLSQESSRRFSLLETRKGMVSVDVDEVVVNISELKIRLESVYAATARVSNLSLVNFL